MIDRPFVIEFGEAWRRSTNITSISYIQFLSLSSSSWHLMVIQTFECQGTFNNHFFLVWNTITFNWFIYQFWQLNWHSSDVFFIPLILPSYCLLNRRRKMADSEWNEKSEGKKKGLKKRNEIVCPRMERKDMIEPLFSISDTCWFFPSIVWLRE